MKQLSILGILILVVLFAGVFTLFARIRGEAFFYVTGPLFGAQLAAMGYWRDPSALIKGGAIGGLCQGVIAVLVMKRGYIFADFGKFTAGLFLVNLAVHLMAGLVFGLLLYLALRWARPPSAIR